MRRWTLPALVAVLTATPLPAQTISGRALEERTERPVAGVAVTLVTPAGDVAMRASTDSVGRFVLRAPVDGEYYVEAVRLGYRFARSPLLAVRAGPGTAPMDFLLQPVPVGLEGLEVTVDANERLSRQLEGAGLSMERLGARFVDRDALESVEGAVDVAAILKWRNIPGIVIGHTEDAATGGDDLGVCVTFRRARRGSGFERCAMVVMDGTPVPGAAVEGMPLDGVAAVALLSPEESFALYGQRGGGGALLIWTRSGQGR